MKAVVYDKYGPPDVLTPKEVEKPVPGDDDVLIKLRAASINDWDWGLLRGKPFINRLLFGLLKPRYNILGSDIAGEVEAVGTNIKRFQSGDQVFGDLSGLNWGGFAEYVCAPEKRLAIKPSGMSFEQAAAIPQAAVLALQGLQDKRQLQPGEKVLINGAGGGTGSFAIQIARTMGVVITGVDSTTKLEKMRELGADHVIDYTKVDFTRTGDQYDLIVDLMGFHRTLDYVRSLKPGGTYVMVGGATRLILGVFLLGPLITFFSGKKMSVLAHSPNKNLDTLITLFDQGKVTPTIDKTFPLERTADAFRHFGGGHLKGKVIVTMEL
jgi:NADPH:quinone reductase-like Zn-dependent oxidoreductase